MKEIINISIKNLKKRKKRSFLTIIGIFIGIAAIFTLVSLSQGLKDSVKEQFNLMGADKILIQPGGGFTSIGGVTEKLDDSDLDVIKKVPGVDIAAGVIMKVARLSYGGETKYVYVSGVPTDNTIDMVFETLTYKVVDGRKLKKGEENSAYIGYELAYGDFLKKQIKVGNKISIEGQDLKVVGVNKKVGNRADDTQIALPLDTARKILKEPQGYYMIIARAENVDYVSKVAENIKSELRKHRNEKKGEESFSVATAEDFMEIFNNILMIVQIFLIGIATISLIVGSIGIMNSMYTAVLERTKEIGVMKAIGAKNNDILKIFMIEAGVIGAIGGIIGVFFGYVLAKVGEYLIRFAMGTDVFSASTPWWLFAALIVLAFGIGSLSGILPARQASNLNPVDALRYE